MFTHSLFNLGLNFGAAAGRVAASPEPARINCRPIEGTQVRTRKVSFWVSVAPRLYFEAPDVLRHIEDALSACASFGLNVTISEDARTGEATAVVSGWVDADDVE
jgi:hypothetical protein